MLTSEDLEQIRAVVQAAVSTAQDATAAMVQAAISSSQDATAAMVQAAVSAAQDATVANLTELRAELTARADADARRLDRISESLRGMQIQLAGFSRWADSLDRDYPQIDRALREIRSRLDALEQRGQ